MVVVDTGSKDDTPQIAKQLGAKVSTFPWCDDFSAARNVSLERATGEWLFWMDSDDTIPPDCGQRLKALAHGEHQASILGYVMQVHCPGLSVDDGHDVTVVDHVKLIRNLPELRFEGRIHEQVIPTIRRLGGEIGWTDIYVLHSGADPSPAGRQAKHERDLRILRLDLADRPNHPFVLFNLGMTYSDIEQHDEAVNWLRRSLAVSRPDESHVRKVYALLVGSLTHLKRLDEAQQFSQEARQRFPKDPELHFREGNLAHAQGRLLDAVAAYRIALRNDDQRHFSSIDPGITGHKARHNLALVYQELGRDDLAELHWRLVQEERPGFKPSAVALVQSLISQCKLSSAALGIENLGKQPELEVESRLLTAELADRAGRVDEAMHRFEELVTRFPDRRDVHEARCKFLFQRASARETEVALRELLDRFPADGAAWHNLANIYLTQRRLGEAVGALQQSLHVRPNSPATRRQLEDLLEPAYG
jgi:tetratricopeptide (TPR) repeat protein